MTMRREVRCVNFENQARMREGFVKKKKRCKVAENVICVKTHSHCHFVIGIVNGLTLKIIAVEPASTTKLHENNNKSVIIFVKLNI